MAPTAKEIDEDPDLDDEGDLDVEQYPLPAGLLAAAGINSDEGFDSIKAIPPK